MELKYPSGVLKPFLCLCAMSFLFGCPRAAYIEIYNNTGVHLNLGSAEVEKSIAPRDRGKIVFTSRSFSIRSVLGSWDYRREIPHSGMDGEYFDGTLTLQVEANGSVFVVRKGDDPPVRIENYKQPKGYPLFPTKTD